MHKVFPFWAWVYVGGLLSARAQIIKYSNIAIMGELIVCGSGQHLLVDGGCFISVVWGIMEVCVCFSVSVCVLSPDSVYFSCVGISSIG